MLGKAASYDEIPYFFSDQYDAGMEYSGYATEWDEVVFRGDVAAREFIAFWLKDERLVAGHEHERLGRQRADPRADPLAPSARSPRACRPRGPASSCCSKPMSTRRGPPSPERLGVRGGIALNRLQTPSGRRRVDLARRPLARAAGERRVRAPCARVRRHRSHLEPDDLRQGDQRAPTATTASCAPCSTPASDDPQELFFELALEDVRRAADLLRPVYELSDGRDGFVSFECTPDLADDAEATVEQALEVRNRLDVPNLLIKVAATDAGIDGNRGADRSRRQRQRDAAVLAAALRAGDRRLLERPGTPGRGRQAARRRSPRWRRSSSPASTQRSIPGSRRTRPCADGSRSPTPSSPTPATWASLESSRWKRLEAHGARPQRPLWASTGTKDAGYSDVRYVQELIAPGVISTMPLEDAACVCRPRRRGRLARRPTRARPSSLLGELAEAGIDFAAVTDGLERQGVESFRDSYRELLELHRGEDRRPAERRSPAIHVQRPAGRRSERHGRVAARWIRPSVTLHALPDRAAVDLDAAEAGRSRPVGRARRRPRRRRAAGDARDASPAPTPSC